MSGGDMNRPPSALFRDAPARREARDRLVIISGCGNLAVCIPLGAEYAVQFQMTGVHSNIKQLQVIRNASVLATLHPGKYRAHSDAVVLIAQSLANPPASGVLDLREP